MDTLISNITAYLNYLRMACGLSASVHFAADILHHLPPDALRRLLPYNSHTNPYCLAVKKNRHPACIAYQKRLIDGCGSESFCSKCHAGVCEYIYPICREEKGIGFVAVSGYREKRTGEVGENAALWAGALRDTPIPTALCDVLIPPLALMLQQLFLRFAKESESEYNMILQFLSEYHTGITLSDLCRHFGRSRSYISHMFKRESGMSLRAYCNNLKLEDAGKLLLDTTLSVTEIALDTGFNDVSYFIALFRKKFGISPLQYRHRTKNGK